MDEARTWDALARWYDAIVRVFDGSYSTVRARVAEDLKGYERVLEVAAGTGQFTPALAAVAQQVVATDISPQMVARLRQVFAIRPGNVEVAEMSAYELDAEDRSFDAVFCANGLHVMEHPRLALCEFRRVLRDGGVLIAPTFLHGVDGPRRTLSRALSAVSPFVAHSRYDLAGLCRQLEELSFRVLRAEQLPGLFPLGYIVAEPIRSGGMGAHEAS